MEHVLCRDISHTSYAVSIDAIPVRIRWHAAYPLSYRHLEDVMEPRGVEVDLLSIDHSEARRRYFSGSSLSSKKGRNSATVGWIGKASRSTW